MATPFETFVNAELPKRISIAVPPTGDLDPNKYVVTTGVGLGVKLVDAPTGSGSVISSNIEMIQVVDPNSHDFTLQHTPVTNSLNVFFNGLFLFNFNNYDYIMAGNKVTLSSEHTLTAGDVFYFKYNY